MDFYEGLAQIITSLGFPIVAAAALFWYVNKKDERHRDEIDALKESLDKNTNILNELKGLISLLAEGLKK